MNGRLAGREPDYGHVSQTQEEGTLVSKNGLLQISWPRLIEGSTPAQLDLLLATANDPRITATLPSYPEPEAIANAWNAAANRHVEYFWKNRDNGISNIPGRCNPRPAATQGAAVMIFDEIVADYIHECRDAARAEMRLSAFRFN